MIYNKDCIQVYCGDLLDVLPTLGKVDCVCTDPPYGLSFMGKAWDHSVPGPEYWRAIKEVCKPGAMMLAFGGTRTQHRLTCAIEDAGWEIRDCLMWLYGSGFPKSMDISKAIDKAAGAKRKVIGQRDVGPDIRGDNFHRDGGMRMIADITAPATDAAKQWSGWGTALKPAYEPIVLAMNTLDGTYVNNAIQHGVAGINVDACRIDIGDEAIHAPQSDPSKRVGTVGTDLGISNADIKKFQAAQCESIRKTQEMGRFPANLLLDEESAGQLDSQTGVLKSGSNCMRTKPGGGYHGNIGHAGDVQTTYGDAGGASRFFYCAKAAKKERGEGNDHATVKPLALMTYLLRLLSTPTGGVILDPFAGSGTTALAAKKLGLACICVEKDPHNCDIIVARLEND
jgi:site-specific DNA-methyltransferase (adenine-specific)